MVQGEGASKAAQGNTRRLVLTSAALLERRSDTYEVAERRHLAQVAALVRFIDQPQWIAIEWTDGARPAMYITPARDALLTALLDAAQVGGVPACTCCLLIPFQVTCSQPADRTFLCHHLLVPCDLCVVPPHPPTHPL